MLVQRVHALDTRISRAAASDLGRQVLARCSDCSGSDETTLMRRNITRVKSVVIQRLKTTDVREMLWATARDRRGSSLLRALIAKHAAARHAALQH